MRSNLFEMEGDYIVGGDPLASIAPHFKLQEFHLPDGSVYVHRNLVASLEKLRERLDHPIEILSMEDNTFHVSQVGKAAYVRSASIPALRMCAQELAHIGYFADVREAGDQVFVDIGDPENDCHCTLEEAFAIALMVRHGFDTDEDPFCQVVGPASGSGISFGPADANLKNGTLQMLCNRFFAANSAAYGECFGQHFPEWMSMIAAPAENQLAFAERIADDHGRSLQDPWPSYFQALGQIDAFRKIMAEDVRDQDRDKMAKILQQLYKVKPLVIDDLTCFSALYEIAADGDSLHKALQGIRDRVREEKPSQQEELVRIAVEERAKKTQKAKRAEAMSRCLGILNRQAMEEKLGKQKATADNPHFYLLRRAKVIGVADLYE